MGPAGNDRKNTGAKMSLGTISTIVSLVGALGGGGYVVATTFATNSDLQVVASRTDYIMDKQIESLIGQINLLEAKARAGKATQYDIEQLKYLREELVRMRAIRR